MNYTNSLFVHIFILFLCFSAFLAIFSKANLSIIYFYYVRLMCAAFVNTCCQVFDSFVYCLAKTNRLGAHLEKERKVEFSDHLITFFNPFSSVILSLPSAASKHGCPAVPFLTLSSGHFVPACAGFQTRWWPRRTGLMFTHVSVHVSIYLSFGGGHTSTHWWRNQKSVL